MGIYSTLSTEWPSLAAGRRATRLNVGSYRARMALDVGSYPVYDWVLYSKSL